MARSLRNKPDQPISDHMHPRIYVAMIGLLSLYALSVWVLFGGDYYNDLTFAVVTGLFFIAVAIPATLWLTWRRNSGSDGMNEGTFRDWAAGDFDILTGTFKGAKAAVETLLPIAAVAIGLLALGIIFDIVSHYAL
jgi:hypothetical protein